MAHKPEITAAKEREYKRLAEERAMTDREAEALAAHLWGEEGVAWHPAYTKPGDLRYCTVGLRIGDVREDWRILGRGETWPDAFAAAKGKAA